MDLIVRNNTNKFEIIYLIIIVVYLIIIVLICTINVLYSKKPKDDGQYLKYIVTVLAIICGCLLIYYPIIYLNKFSLSYCEMNQKKSINCKFKSINQKFDKFVHIIPTILGFIILYLNND